MIKAWSDVAWADYLWWQDNDRKTVKKINRLLREVERDPFAGIGKPEPLRGRYSGLWSRRIDQANRLIYHVEGDTLFIHAMKDHYGDK